MGTYFKKRKESFGHAFRGVKTLFNETPNATIHLVMAILAVTLGFIFHISSGEWLAVIIVIGLVLSLEAMNTAIETLADFACDKKIHPLIKIVKDVSAAGVLLAAIAALVVGIIIFLPKIIELFK